MRTTLTRFNLFALICSSLSAGCVKNKQESNVHSISQSGAGESKKITFIAGPLSRSIAVSQIESFVTQRGSFEDVTALLQAGKINPTEIREQLGKVYTLDLLQMDKILNSQIGVALLTRLSDAIHPHNDKSATVQAVRSAIILSLASDNQLSPLEVLQNLPVDMDVEVIELMKLKKDLGGVFGSAVL